MTTALITHDDCIKHDMGAYHPESPLRLKVIKQRLRDGGLYQDLAVFEAKAAADEQLVRAHPQHHIDRVRQSSPENGNMALDPDTSMCPDTLNAALLAAGAVVQAVDGVISGAYDNAFCAVRPPGHHAETDTSMGFCFFNNIAVGVRHAMAAHGIKRAAVLDFDVHHGNGTVDIFKDDPSVMVCSTFQHPFYPGRYADIDRDNIRNSPLSVGSDGDDLRAAVDQDWLPALEAHRPEIIFISAGFDAHRDDPLGGLNWLEQDYCWVSDIIVEAGKAYADGRIVSVLEGGYDPRALAASVEAHIAALAQK